VAGADAEIAAVLVYDCPEEVMESRLLERGKTSGRTDDNIESIRKRFNTFRNETKPVLDYYSHKNLVHTIDGTRSIEEVTEDSQAFIRALEHKLSSRPAELKLHIYTNADSDADAYLPPLSERLQRDMAHRWGEGAVAVDVHTLSVTKSVKAFELDSLRAFD